jgi:predicted phage baseplate assembly protein
MSCSGGQNCSCGCCLGISVQTPQGESNLPGLPAIAYRTGTWATFNESMLARLSSSDYPALAYLQTRDNDDFSIAFLDATAVMLDILTFYQERLANESYLRTATQLYSLTQLSQLIGYQPSPGVSASTYLAFTLKSATGLPANPGTTAITIPAGTQVQSAPAQGQTPQTFATSAAALAKPGWNAMQVQTGIPWEPRNGDLGVYLAGTSTQLNPGDAILIVGDERIAKPGTSQRWDVRLVSSVTPDNANARTWVEWSEALGPHPAKKNPIFYALRQRASLFGYNALNPNLLSPKSLKYLQSIGLIGGSPVDWEFGNDTQTGNTLASESLVDLDNTYSKLTPGGWLVLIHPDAEFSRSPAGVVSLYGLLSVTTISRSDYGVSAKITRASTDTSHNLSDYYSDTRSTSVLAQSEALAAAEQPLDYPLYGTFVDLEGVQPDLANIQAVALTGNNPTVTLNEGVTGITFIPDDGSTPVPLAPADVMTVLRPPSIIETTGQIPNWSMQTATAVTFTVADSNGRSGTMSVIPADLTIGPPPGGAPVVQEYALVSSISVIAKPYPHTRIVLATPLLYCYDRASTTVNANLAPANAGSAVTELLGNGSAATPNQQFTLKQTPLTYTQASTPTGSLSSLSVSANGVSWTLVPSLYNQSPSAQVFTAINLPGGGARVVFGDGVEGATLPTGQANIQASYRIGIGAAGNVPVGTITTLMDRPLGVGSVTNPLAATGGQDPQSIDDIRANAPLSVLTLGRAVSITDYQNFAASFAGIAKASALWIPAGLYRGVFLTVAGAGGIALPSTSPTINYLTTALANFGNPNIPVYAFSFLETLFSLSANIAYNPAYDSATVEAAVLVMLASTYSFASRSFGQGVSGDEIAALIQAIPGVVAVNVTSVNVVATSAAGDLAATGYSVSAYNNWLAQQVTLQRASSGSATRICAYTPVATSGALPLPAEILVLDPAPSSVVLGVMS